MSAGDPAILADEADYLQWGKWVVHEHMAVHLVEELDSSIVFYPTSACCALDCDVAYWKNRADVARQEKFRSIVMPKPVGVYKLPELAIDGVHLPEDVTNEVIGAHKRRYASMCAKYEADVAVVNSDLQTHADSTIRHAKRVALFMLWCRITSSLRGCYRWVVSSVLLGDVRSLLHNLDEMFEHTRPWRPAVSIPAVVSKTEPIQSVLNATVAMVGSKLATRGVSIPDDSMPVSSKSSKSARRRSVSHDTTGLPIFEVIDPSARTHGCAYSFMDASNFASRIAAPVVVNKKMHANTKSCKTARRRQVSCGTTDLSYSGDEPKSKIVSWRRPTDLPQLKNQASNNTGMHLRKDETLVVDLREVATPMVNHDNPVGKLQLKGSAGADESFKVEGSKTAWWPASGDDEDPFKRKEQETGQDPSSCKSARKNKVNMYMFHVISPSSVVASTHSNSIAAPVVVQPNIVCDQMAPVPRDDHGPVSRYWHFVAPPKIPTFCNANSNFVQLPKIHTQCDALCREFSKRGTCRWAQCKYKHQLRPPPALVYLLNKRQLRPPPALVQCAHCKKIDHHTSSCRYNSRVDEGASAAPVVNLPIIAPVLPLLHEKEYDLISKYWKYVKSSALPSEPVCREYNKHGKCRWTKCKYTHNLQVPAASQVLHAQQANCTLCKMPGHLADECSRMIHAVGDVCTHKKLLVKDLVDVNDKSVQVEMYVPAKCYSVGHALNNFKTPRKTTKHVRVDVVDRSTEFKLVKRSMTTAGERPLGGLTTKNW